MTLILAIIAGIVFPYSGFQLQYRFKNQLMDVYSIGLGSLTCASAALGAYLHFSMKTTALIIDIIYILLTTIICKKTSTRTFITFGLVMGTITGALGTIMCNNLSPTALSEYYRWTSASFQNSEGAFLTIIGFITFLIFMNLCDTKVKMYLLTGLLCSVTIYSVGIIWVISLVAPNLANLYNGSIKERLGLCIGIGILLSVSAWILTTSVTSIYLPVSATMSALIMPIYIVLMNINKR